MSRHDRYVGVPGQKGPVYIILRRRYGVVAEIPAVVQILRTVYSIAGTIAFCGKNI